MGQSQSWEGNASPEKLSQKLAVKFAEKCFTQLELYCFKEVFASLADQQSDVSYWNEATLCRYLELPDEVGPVVYQMASFLGAFPFPSQAPCILTFDALVKVVTIMTERYTRILKRGTKDRMKIFYGSLAVFDRRASQLLESPGAQPEGEIRQGQISEGIPIGSKGFAIDQAANDDDDADQHDDDDLALAALDALDSIEVVGLGERQNVNHSIIPIDNLLRLIQLLLLIAPLDMRESISKHTQRLSDEELKGVRKTAEHILNAFGMEPQPGITFHTFSKVVPTSLPYLFDGFNSLFENFLFEKDFDLSKRRRESSAGGSSKIPSNVPPRPASPPLEPLLPSEGDLLDSNVLSQLSFFLKPSTIFRHLHPLFFGSEHGFSMGAFEKHVFNWQAPSIFLVSGTLLPEKPSNSRERTFADSLPPKRFPNGPRSSHNTTSTSTTSASNANRVVYGAYVPTPWKHSHSNPFGNASALLFQLGPTHDVFRASSLRKDYVTFSVPPIGGGTYGINFGSPLTDSFFPAPGDSANSPMMSSSPTFSRSGITRRSSSVSSPTSSHYGGPTRQFVPLGPVSLYLDDGLEFAVFTHSSAGGGSYHRSSAPARNNMDWQDRFEIDAVEVWGCGGSKEADGQRRAMEWEEREARLRRQINIGRGGDAEADKELLRIAGLVGFGESGGSMG